MKLLTKEIEELFAKIGNQENIKDPLVIAKFFDPTSSWTWFATEYNPKDQIFFGMVHGFEKEMGYFSLDELQNVKCRFGLRLERDRGFRPCWLSQIENTGG